MDAKAAIAVGRDVILMLLGATGIIHQEFVGPVKIELLVLYGAMLGIPGATNILALMRGAQTGQSVSGTGSSSSASASSPSQLP